MNLRQRHKQQRQPQPTPQQQQGAAAPPASPCEQRNPQAAAAPAGGDAAVGRQRLPLVAAPQGDLAAVVAGNVLRADVSCGLVPVCTGKGGADVGSTPATGTLHVDASGACGVEMADGRQLTMQTFERGSGLPDGYKHDWRVRAHNPTGTAPWLPLLLDV